MGYMYIFGTILFTVYGQLILKWRIATYGALPELFFDKLIFLVKLLFDPYIFSGFASAFIASFFWMATMTKFELSFAYPFMALNFVLVLFLSTWLLNEPITFQRILGIGLIVFGTVIAARG